MRWALRACAVAAAAVGACGKSDDQKRVEQRQAICDSLVSGSQRVEDAASRFGGGQLSFDAARFASGQQALAP